MDGTQPTQATQNVLDPRRVGKQNSGFSDEDISDIICVLYPQSDSARQEVQWLAQQGSPHVIGKDEADEVEPDYELEDHASRFESHPTNHGNYAIILRLSSQIKNPAAGFAFGRNTTRCDVVFANDPLRRLSNIHFRIHVNEYGNVMIEDQSTNGTFVDRQLLTCHSKDRNPQSTNKWVLSSGTLIKILLHDAMRDLTFRVRVPRRDEDYDRAYLARVQDYFTRHGLQPCRGGGGGGGGGGNGRAQPQANTGIVDIFKVPGAPLNKKVGFLANPTNLGRPLQSPARKELLLSGTGTEWKGSGKYNRVGMIGKGAFAVVHKVTSKFNGLPYAAKEIEKRRFIKNGVLDQKVENEMKIMQRVHHPNIVRYIENFDWEDRLLIIIMEFVPGGDLGRTITPDAQFNVQMTQTISTQLLSALGYLHANNITHRDVKPDNILIQSLDPLVVKLTDFGLSKMIDSAETFLRTFCGTLLYCAPEVYTEYAEYDEHGHRTRGKKMRRRLGQRYGHAVDIWSLGGVLFYALTASPPYPVKSGISHSELLHKIMTTGLDTRPLQRHGVDEEGVDFIRRMLDKRPEYRATVSDLESHPWLSGLGSSVQASQSYDEITDDDEYPSQLLLREQPDYGDEMVSDSASDFSDKENGPMVEDSRQEQQQENQQQPRLFGEVGASALGSSGAIPSDFLSLSPEHSMDVMEIDDSLEGDAYDSADSDTISGRNQRAYRHNSTSICPNQSTDQLQSLVEIVASQSLGGSDGSDGSPGRPTQASHDAQDDASMSRRPSYSRDPNSSKRKPCSNEPSDEDFDDKRPPPRQPVIKRLKSEGNLVVGDISDDVLDEYKLLARMPQVLRLESGRLIDHPVSKMEFWEQDKKTWHLRYPEMTQLQHDAFKQAARNGGEEFWPGKTPLWGLAMKYFPPSSSPGPGSGERSNEMSVVPTSGPVLKREGSKLANRMTMMEDIPSTAAPIEPDFLPSTCPPDTKIVVPVQEDMSASRAVALVDTDASSCVQGISFPVTDVLLSFGRGPENTEVFQDKLEPRVPKYAFKLLLWKDGYDPSRHVGKSDKPWCKEGANKEEASSYHFWISSKATLGIRINGYNLASSDPKNPSYPSRYWAKVYDGDSLTIWGGQDAENQTTLALRCLWGGSARSRPAERRRLEVAPPDVAARLDRACQRTERRMRDIAEKERMSDEARTEFTERKRHVERERERSRVFEEKRQEAVAFLAAAASYTRRASASPARALGMTGQRGKMGANMARLGPDRAVAYYGR
ncbi:hypothetical protein E4U42_005816 [Claviceps africana]|uniref:Uncharacterized protein n=1 Tax=Claviceps africana TaxID=83212 RepID=A0A8K0NJ14_9HYPO|nr:hypothetical protein E4U42_005816 [Claviceps africana]